MTTTTQTEQLVTVVRQRLVLEEVVMKKEVFDTYNNQYSCIRALKNNNNKFRCVLKKINT